MNLTAAQRRRPIITNMRPGSILEAEPPQRRARRGTGKKAQAKRRSLLEQRFALRWKGPPYVDQYRFDPTRRWRFDVCWPDAWIAVELHGGTWNAGRHVRGGGFERDREKINRAQELGWMVYELTGEMLTDEWMDRIKRRVEL